MKAAAKVFLVEDHPLFRESIADLINQEQDMTVCGETDNGKDAMDLISAVQPDIIVMDLSLNGLGGLDVIRNLRAHGVEIPILVLSMHDESLYAERALRAGANGYVSKCEPSAGVRTAIQKVLAGNVYLSLQSATRLLRRMPGHRSLEHSSGVASLTERELAVFRLLGSGLTSNEIAERLGFLKGTVNSYRYSIRLKLQIKNAAELYRCAATWVKDEASSAAIMHD